MARNSLGSADMYVIIFSARTEPSALWLVASELFRGQLGISTCKKPILMAFVWYAALPAFLGGTVVVRHLLALLSAFLSSHSSHSSQMRQQQDTTTREHDMPSIIFDTLHDHQVWLLAAVWHLLNRRKARQERRRDEKRSCAKMHRLPSFELIRDPKYSC